jgi:outer membrane receptor protein involved in Fe transport
VQLRAGISNIFDKQPPTTGSSIPLYSSAGLLTGLASSGAGATNSNFYDVLGRRFYVGIRASF